MTTGVAFDDYAKPFPTPALAASGDEFPPPDYHPQYQPPQIVTDLVAASSLPQINELPSFGSLDPGLIVPPLTPTSPSGSALPSPSFESKQKKSNPLIDLIDTERVYVDQLTGVIRKVAAAWSRSNLPPTELDAMFRSIEGVYKANRSLLGKLKGIGTNPSSPKALGDLLMRWIDDLEAPYTTYCSRYLAGFDVWEPVQSNPRLRPILSTFSETNLPPPSSDNTDQVWTLDALFLLPKARLKYYRKLYSRLLKSTQAGRSDHRLLMGALDRLDKLLATVESRESMQVDPSAAPAPLPPMPMDDEEFVGIDRDPYQQNRYGGPNEHSGQGDQNGQQAGDLGAGNANGSASSGYRERFSPEMASTSISRGSTQTMTMPISDLEQRLATDRTIDIFTMQPKAVRLQIAPPSLPYQRELRFSIDAIIRLTPRSTGVEVAHRQGHLFLLSDLFLICERIAPEERWRAEGADMWLCYPPLAGKVLRVSEVPGQDDSLQISIMRKENLFVQVESVELRNFMLREFMECIDFASNALAPSRQHAPPPLTGLPRSPSAGLPRSPSAPLSSNRGPSPQDFLPQHTSDDNGFTQYQPLVGRPSTADNYSRPSHENEHLQRNLRMSDGNSNFPRSPPMPTQQTPQGIPHQHDFPGPGPHMRPPRSGQPLSAPPSPYALGQGLPPPRGAGMNVPDPSFRGHPNHNIGQPPQGFYQPPHNPLTNQLQTSQQYGAMPPRVPAYQPGLNKSPSGRSIGSQYDQQHSPAPPLPPLPGGPPLNGNYFSDRNGPPGAQMPSANNARAFPGAQPTETSPPTSPSEITKPMGPITSTISANMKCKVFLQQQHAQWKSLGSAKLKLYRQQPTNVKQLVVEADNKDKTILISTIVLTDGVERVGKTGVAIELSDKGARTGIVYMIQLRNETSAGGLFDSLLAGSDRAARG